ncbi:MAG: PBECR2 nuclease fold domain-containing protein [Butyrivibrio sp.]|nr:PBECR2 nuclease fold domain-containing protein [Acetatifactor muris]MCM1561162.1 PBECR2 nuclease fold domain-containing protein [Butyrivibrio sp.]
MLTTEQEDIIGGALSPLFQYLEHEVIVDVANRIQATMAYSRTAELEAQRLSDLGFSAVQIRKEAMKILRADSAYQKEVAKNTLEHKRTVKKLLQEITDKARKAAAWVIKRAADLSYLDDLHVWKQAGKSLTDKSFLPQLVEAVGKQTADTMKSLAQSTGFKTMSGYEPVESLYRRELDKAMIKVCTGTFSQEQVVYDTVRSLSASGLRNIDFTSGYSMQLDTAVKLAVRTGAHQVSARIMDANIQSTGENLVYVSKHWGARNTGIGHANHEQWQGKVYFIKDGTDYSGEAHRINQDRIMSLWYATGYSVDGSRENDPLGLNGYNCRHKHYVWFEGVSSLPKEDPEPEPVTVNGKNYDYYAMSQKMRSMERNIRALKREREALSSLGMDTKEVSARIKGKIREYEEFCRDCGVKSDINRLRYECGTSDLTKTEAWQEYYSEKKVVADDLESGTMDLSKEEKRIEVHTVGRINKDMYKCITEDITTDEVIITDERIAHIKERHPSDYERYYKYLKEIVEHPQYIIEVNKPYTALLLKEFSVGEESFKTVLRLITSHDNPEFKNSIITFMKINDREWKRLLKNKRILYKEE